MDTAFVLHHVRSGDEYGDHAKLIGVYLSDAAAEAAIERLRDQPGFRDHPAGFHISAYPFNQDHWSEGFVDIPPTPAPRSRRSGRRWWRSRR